MLPIAIGGLVAVSLAVTYLTNPFSRFSVIKSPFRAYLDAKTHTIIDENNRLKIRGNLLWRLFAIYQCGIYIVTTRYIHSPAAGSKDLDGIISDIHRLRYDPNKLLLISGDHFNGLFVRNLGVFYYPMLDRAIAGSQQDWYDRQTVYLQTVAYALGVFAKSSVLTTTIVSTGRYAATPVNFYAYPSDSLFGIVYALASLKGIESAQPYPYGTPHFALDTKGAAKELLQTYGTTLAALYDNYTDTAYDSMSGLVRRDLHMSGAKDITRRYSAFYDNVVYWKTMQLGMKLGIIPTDKKFLAGLKERILATFWLPDEGYFLEDLSDEGIKNKYYSSDWLIVLATGFLDPLDAYETQYFTRSVDYIQQQKIDQPFAIKYQQSTRAHRQFLAVRLAVASYGGDAIWSFWGMEYIKTLVLLYKRTNDHKYKKAAKYHLDKYQQKMVEHGGFPEVYDADGKLLQTPLYRSIRQTGWVIGFEQAREMYRDICE
jgi:hypothetical protein